jgi:hypothetical protein
VLVFFVDDDNDDVDDGRLLDGIPAEFRDDTGTKALKKI